MNTIKFTFRLLRRCLLWLLIAYWGTFIGYTIMHWSNGGSVAVVAWYQHISYSHNSFKIRSWSWERFITGQLAILIVTFILLFFERQPKHSKI
jgi:hypothetical protein